MAQDHQKQTRPIYVLNGPNLNLIGEREPQIYGRETLSDIEKAMRAKAREQGHDIVFRQTNREGELVDWIQEARQAASAVILNAGGYSHTSIAILDACRALRIPLIEVSTKVMFTNTVLVSAYRGAGRPEGNFYMERLIDRAADEMKIDRLSLRKRNQLAPA